MCYGQTGSGKTFTTEQLTRLATADIFDTIAELPHRDYALCGSALEIYNEKVTDLLKDHTEHQSLDVLNTCSKPALLVKGLTVLPLTTAEDLSALVKEACNRRTVRGPRRLLARQPACNLTGCLILTSQAIRANIPRRGFQLYKHCWVCCTAWLTAWAAKARGQQNFFFGSSDNKLLTLVAGVAEQRHKGKSAKLPLPSGYTDSHRKPAVATCRLRVASTPW